MQSLFSGNGRCHGDQGQMLPWMALILLVGFGLAVFAARFGPILDESAQARTAADASALAGAAEGRKAAEEYAQLNRGHPYRLRKDEPRGAGHGAGGAGHRHGPR